MANSSKEISRPETGIDAKACGGRKLKRRSQFKKHVNWRSTRQPCNAEHTFDCCVLRIYFCKSFAEFDRVPTKSRWKSTSSDHFSAFSSVIQPTLVVRLTSGIISLCRVNSSLWSPRRESFGFSRIDRSPLTQLSDTDSDVSVGNSFDRFLRFRTGNVTDSSGLFSVS